MTVEDKYRARGDEAMLEAVTILERPPLIPERTALVVVDMLNRSCVKGVGNIRSIEASGLRLDYYLQRVQSVVVPNHQKLLGVCRQHGVRVVWIAGGCYSPDFSDCIPQFKVMYKSWNALEGTWEMQPVDPLKVESGDIYLLKAGAGGFTSPLDIRLRNMGIEQVIYTGTVTNVGVLHTMTAGFDLGYHGWLVSDATATLWERWQAITEELISGYMARVVSTDEMIKIITGGS